MATPVHKIYSSADVLVYTFEHVIRRDPPIAIDVPNEVELTNLRGNGSITISGGNAPYNISLYVRLGGTNYTTVMSALNTLKTTVLVKTNYYLKYDKTLVHDESLESIKVRLKEINVDTSRGNLTKFVYVTLIFRALSW